jgi:hypothetical protein
LRTGTRRRAEEIGSMNHGAASKQPLDSLLGTLVELNVFSQMVESIMYIGIGLLSGCLIGVAVMPLVHDRAVRLTVRRLEAPSHNRLRRSNPIKTCCARNSQCQRDAKR